MALEYLSEKENYRKKKRLTKSLMDATNHKNAVIG